MCNASARSRIRDEPVIVDLLIADFADAVRAFVHFRKRVIDVARARCELLHDRHVGDELFDL